MPPGRHPNGYDEFTKLIHRFVRRENTYYIALMLLRKQAQARNDMATVFLINSVFQRANEGDGIKLDLIAWIEAVGEE